MIEAENDLTGSAVFEAGTWKEDSDKLFGPKEAVAVWDYLSSAYLGLKNSSDLVFVSPTANIPTHEAAIFVADSKRREGRSLFLVGDRQSLSRYEEEGVNTDERHQFYQFRWNGAHLPLAPGSADVIWDRKGLLWHDAAYGSGQDVLAELAGYSKLLKPGGLVVVDDIDEMDTYNLFPIKRLYQFQRMGSIMKKIQNGSMPLTRPSAFMPYEHKQYEKSTSHFISNYPGLWQKIGERFDIQRLGKGQLQNIVLQKR